MSGVAAVVALAVAAPAGGSLQRGGAGVEWLDRPGHASYWAFVELPVTARVRPDRASRRVGRLGLKTEDDTDNLVLVLARRVKDGREWLKVRLPMLPNNSTGWVPASSLGSLHRVRTWLRIDRARLRIRLVRDGKVIFRAPIGIGRPESPTPKGNFYVRDELTGFPAGTIYGALAFGTSAKSAVLTDWPKGGVIGIHGTNQPSLLPGRVSHGCIRLRNANIRRLAHLLPIGTPISIT